MVCVSLAIFIHFVNIFWMSARKKITNANVSFSLVYWQHQGITLWQTNARTMQSLNLVSLLKLVTRVKGLMFTHGIHITLQHIVRRWTERVEKFCHMVVCVRIRPKRSTCLCRFEYCESVTVTDWQCICPCRTASVFVSVSVSRSVRVHVRARVAVCVKRVHTYVWKAVRKVSSLK